MTSKLVFLVAWLVLSASGAALAECNDEPGRETPNPPPATQDDGGREPPPPQPTPQGSGGRYGGP